MPRIAASSGPGQAGRTHKKQHVLLLASADTRLSSCCARGFCSFFFLPGRDDGAELKLASGVRSRPPGEKNWGGASMLRIAASPHQTPRSAQTRHRLHRSATRRPAAQQLRGQQPAVQQLSSSEFSNLQSSSSQPGRPPIASSSCSSAPPRSNATGSNGSSHSNTPPRWRRRAQQKARINVAIGVSSGPPGNLHRFRGLSDWHVRPPARPTVTAFARRAVTALGAAADGRARAVAVFARHRLLFTLGTSCRRCHRRHRQIRGRLRATRCAWRASIHGIRRQPQALRFEHSIRIQCESNAHSMRVQCAFNAHAMRIQCAFNAHSVRVQGAFNARMRYAHLTCTGSLRRRRSHRHLG